MYLCWAHGLEDPVTGNTSWAEDCDMLRKGHSALSSARSPLPGSQPWTAPRLPTWSLAPPLPVAGCLCLKALLL